MARPMTPVRVTVLPVRYAEGSEQKFVPAPLATAGDAPDTLYGGIEMAHRTARVKDARK